MHRREVPDIESEFERVSLDDGENRAGIAVPRHCELLAGSRAGDEQQASLMLVVEVMRRPVLVF
jgi:hypothetical protein